MISLSNLSPPPRLEEPHTSAAVSTSENFSTIVSPLALLKLEEHDEPIAAITRSSTSISAASDSEASSHVDPQDESTITSFSPEDSKARVSSIRREDLRRINPIGTGRFCKVHLAATNAASGKHERPSLVAVKSIDLNRIRDASQFALAAGELANEAKILSELDHENIVRLKGICSESFSGSFHSGGGYFLVLEILRETLCDRLQKWRRQKQKKERLYRKTRNSVRKARKAISLLPRLLLQPNHPISKALLLRDASRSTILTDVEPELEERKRRMHHRIKETVLGIASGLEYLHSKGIVLRDLKPANIGYEDSHGVQYGTSRMDDTRLGEYSSSVRLFDFGMAQKLEACDPNEVCGTLRYMAPEAMVGKGYSLKVDVYSFGVVLYEICSLRHPFEMKTPRSKKLKTKLLFSKKASKSDHQRMEDFCERVLSGKAVPAKDLHGSVCCPELASLIEDCLSLDPDERPSFLEIRARLGVIFDDGNTAEVASGCKHPYSLREVHRIQEPRRDPSKESSEFTTHHDTTSSSTQTD